jgi:hydroxyacylglutathione hydrolase
MLFRMIYDDTLAQAAYLIGCQKTGEAIVFDPERDVDRYIALAKKEGVRITAVAETHIHADFVSGARELAERTGAKVYVSGEGGPDWQTRWLDKKTGGGAYNHQVLRDGDTFAIGNIEFKALHTPGHTPEHMCYLVTDRGGGASEPMGVITGDFLFVGDVGRPDLLETAAGQAGAKEPSAAELYRSIRKFLELPDYLQVWPAHGAGSACGKALGAVPQSTLGYERRFNPSLRAAQGDERGFVDFILSGQPEPPLYFGRMKRINRDGPPVLGSLPRPPRMNPAEFAALDGRAVAIIDTRPWAAFRAGHVRGALSIPLDNTFPTLAGSYVREDEPVYLVVDEPRVEEAVRAMIRVGVDLVRGYITPADMEAVAAAGAPIETTAEQDADEAKSRLSDPGTFVLDVRRADEFAAGHIPGALNAVHTRIPALADRVPKDKRILVNCRSGIRSARASSYLQRLGYDVTNLAGGFLAWEQSKGPVER